MIAGADRRVNLSNTTDAAATSWAAGQRQRAALDGKHEEPLAPLGGGEGARQRGEGAGSHTGPNRLRSTVFTATIQEASVSYTQDNSRWPIRHR